MARRTHRERALREAIENWRAGTDELYDQIAELMASLTEYERKGLIPKGVGLAIEEIKPGIYKQFGLVEARARDALARLDDLWIENQNRKNNLPSRFKLKEKSE